MRPVTITETCIELIESGPTEALTTEWADLAGRSFVDTIGVLIAGKSDTAVKAVAASIEEKDGPTRSLATGAPMTARSAALIDGVSAHALDYDDVDDAVIAHPSAVLVPGLIAAGAGTAADGRALVGAYRTGVRTSRLMAAALGIREHYETGWHSTGTIGAIAAAASIAQLRRLSTDHTRNALGIAASLAAGSRQSFGSMVKPLHAGVAAANGLLAAQLASNGLIADPDLLGGPLGFLELHSRTGAGELLDLAAPALDVPRLNTKLFPCCYYTHSAAEAALGSTVDTASVQEVEVVVQPGGLAPLVHQRPLSGAQAKFSMEYVVAVALLDKALTLRSFEEPRVIGADVQQLLRKVTVSTSSQPPFGQSVQAGDPFAAITILLDGGQTLTSRVNRPAGHASRPVSDTQLFDKFSDCVRGAERTLVDSALSKLRSVVEIPSIAELVDIVTQVSEPLTEVGR